MAPRFISTLLCFYIVGVGIGSLYSVPNNLLIIVLIGGIFTAIIILACFRETVALAGVYLLATLLGSGLGYWQVSDSFRNNEYESYIGKQIDTEGIVAADPTTSGRNQVVILLPDGYGQYLRASLYAPIPALAKGDRVWIRGQLEIPENFSEFDYIGYLQRWQIYAELRKPRVIVLHRSAWNWRTPLLAIRIFVMKQGLVFPERQGSLIIGMLIGQRQNIPKEVSEAFKIAGLTHIVAVSGFNMTIIATACSALVWYIGRRAGNIITIIIVIGFVVITGATAAVVRAAIMAVLMVAAQLMGRLYASLYALLIVSTIMIVINPRIVVWDIGFQLSAAATFGVLIAFRIKDPEKDDSFLIDLLRPTMGAIFMTAPIIAYHFKTLSLIAPIANLLVLPFVTWIMLFGSLSLLPLFGGVFVLPAQILTTSVLFIAEQMAKVPFASINFHMPAWSLIIYYSLLVIYVKYRLQKGKKSGKLEKIITNTL